MAIQIRRGTNTEWESNNSNIVVGEPAIATDAERFFVGTASGDYAEFANIDVIAPAYDTTTSYVVGDIINYHGKLYSCNAPCSGAFNASYWDEKSLAEILKDLENEIDYAQYEIGYADGKLITINNGASEIPVKDLTVDIEAVQSGSGDPSPTNIRPISGWDKVNVTRTGKNLFSVDKAVSDSALPSVVYKDGEWLHFMTGGERLVYNFETSKQITFSAVVKSGNTSSNIIGFSAVYSDGTSAELCRVVTTDTNEHTISGTSTEGKFVTQIRSLWSYSKPAFAKNIQIEFGSTATAYEPYNGTTYTTDLDGTRYGGTLDVTTGVLTIDRGYVDLGTLTWSQHATYTQCWTTIMQSVADFPAPAYNNRGLCSAFVVKQANSFADITNNEGIYISPISWSSTTKLILINEDAYVSYDAATFKTAMSGQKLVYELATPQVVQLTPTQVRTVLGTNNIWNQMNTNNELAYRISNALN